MRLAELKRTVADRTGPMRLGGVRGSAGAYLVSQLRRAHAGPLLVISPGPARAERFAAELRTFLGVNGSDDARVVVFPAHDTPPFDRFSPHPEIESRRMSLLYRLLSAGDDTAITLVAPWSALARRVPSREELRTRIRHLERGMTVDRDALLEVLVAAGYHRTALVEERGEVAARGGIIDLFPPQLEQPVRIEFDFEEIGALRLFDPVTQRSSADLREMVAIPPRAFRLPAEDAALDALVHAVRERGRSRRIPESNVYTLCEALGRRYPSPGIENLEALLHDGMETPFDYLAPNTLIAIDDPEAGRSEAATFTEEVFQGHAEASRDDRLVCDPLELYTTDDSAWDRAVAARAVLLDALAVPGADANERYVEVDGRDHADLRRGVLERRGSGRALEPLRERLVAWKEDGRRVRIVCPSLSAADRFGDLLREYGTEVPICADATSWDAFPEPGEPEICISPVKQGFELPSEGLVLLTEEDVFGARLQRRNVRPLRTGQAVDRLAQIQEDDLLVHAEHGIGRYGGLTQLQIGGVRQEFLLLAYGQGDKLYLPISRLAQVQRYTGSDEQRPVLDRLGGQSWGRSKKRVQRAVRDMARQLIAVYAAREVLAGRATPVGSDYEEFEAAFPYEDTPDQRRATEEVLADLAKERPMDRLVCGDVGFGKTEIACRAAHVVASDSRQVAFLVPTTVLCQQHAESLRARFANTAIEVASLSRLTTPKQARAVREGLASGRIDLVVGTHRLLSKDVVFRNLGLLIIDEEHRFGVTHKERLKEMRKLIDVLTLSATPIPRTLQMALSGMRDLSAIATPPPDRIAVRTQVCRLADEVVVDALQRELRRSGQAFVVHNRVETIQEFARYVETLVPEARIAIAHGQMPTAQLEKVMLGFLRREFDILVCTSIIESGLDIPNANTILIHRADLFGLAQLYQLRGRVGRSDRRAHAYLFLPPEGALTDDARKRIEAIQDLSELGAGMRLAMSDLEIRGAGNMLGSAQSGHITEVGYDLYMEMLEKAIAEMRGQGGEDELEPEIRLPVAAMLPESYVPDPAQRLVMYKQLSSARNEADVADTRATLLDRFGATPPEAERLFDVIRLKIGCRRLGIEAIETRGSELVLRVAERTRIEPRQLLRVIDKPGTPYRVSPDHSIHLKIRSNEDALAEAFGALDLLAPEGELGGEGTETRLQGGST